MSQGFSDDSILPEGLHHEEEEEEELILDGGLPRYASSLTSDLLPVEESREMAVDEEEEEVKMEEKAQGRVGSFPRKPPPSWEEWKLCSSVRPGGAEEVS